MEVKSKKAWAAPSILSAAPERGALLLVCSPTTQWDCDPIYLGCGCVTKSADIGTDCDNTCSP